MEQPEEINYKELLYHYMAHVIDCESWSFLENDSGAGTRVPFITDKEREILKEIENKIRDNL